ncbi:MAG: class I SAM-dependent methyltransferase, partial [Candidatus Bathyarchaeota archaeon]
MNNKNQNNLKEVQEKLENELKDNLLKNPSQESFQEAYDKIHTFFIEQEKISSIYSNELNWFSKIFIELSGSGNKVLDIGSGNGKLAISIAEKGNTVIGLDVSKIALDKARERLNNSPQALSVDFRLGDARKLP